VEFFSLLPKSNDLSITAHIAIACFLAAAHETMLETLRKAHNENGLNGPQLLEYWHELMEPTGTRDRREEFFTQVVKRANTVSRFIFFRLSALSILAVEIECGSPPSQSYQGGGRQADNRSLSDISQDLRGPRQGGHRGSDGISFRCPSPEEDSRNVLRRSTRIGFALLDLSASCAASAIVNENVVRLHGNKSKHFLLCTSSQQQCFLCDSKAN